MNYDYKALKNRLHIFSKIVLLTLLISSCIKEDLKDCSNNLALVFQYTLNEKYTDLFQYEVNHLDLLVYNQEGSLVEKQTIRSNQLDNGNTIYLKERPAGTYTYIVWANTEEALYTKNYATSLDDLYIKQNLLPTGEANPLHGSLYHGITTINHAADTQQTHKIELTKNTHLLQIILEDDERSTPLELGDYRIEIFGSNGKYDYANNTIGEELITYKSTYAITSSNTLEANFTLLRLMQDDDVRIRISTKDGEIIYNESLTDKIMLNPTYQTTQDLDRADKFTLHYRVSKSTGDEWTIDLMTVNEWEVMDQNGGMGN